jgi:hypothetical protein
MIVGLSMSPPDHARVAAQLVWKRTDSEVHEVSLLITQTQLLKGGEMRNTILRVALRVLLLTTLLVPVIIEAQTQAAASAPEIKADQPESAPQIRSRAAVIVQEFSVSDKTGWPYDIKQLQSQTVAELRAKSTDKFDVLIGAPATPRTHTYTLEGEIVSWHPGNRAKRMMIGMGSGRETADIHYWLTDERGKKVFDHKDTIRAEFWGNAYAGSVGELAHPFASKIAGRLTEAKLF